MPNISFDIFFQEDIINITASRSGGSAPKIKPAWKVRTAPKLPPKEPPVNPKTAAFGPPKLLKQASPESSKTPSKPSATASKPSTAKPAANPKETPKPKGETNEAAKKPAEAKKTPKLKDQANGKAS